MAKNKTTCAYSRGKVKYQLHWHFTLLEYWSLLKHLQWQISIKLSCYCYFQVLNLSFYGSFFFQNGTLRSKFTLNNFQRYLCNHHTYPCHKGITHMQKTSVGHQLSSTTSQNTTKQEANYDNLLSQCKLTIFIKCIVEK